MTDSNTNYNVPRGIAQHKVRVAAFKQWVDDQGLEGFGTQPTIDGMNAVLVGPLLNVIANYMTNQLSDDEVLQRVVSDPAMAIDLKYYGDGNWANDDDASIWDDDEAAPGSALEKKTIEKAKNKERVKGARDLFDGETRMKWHALIESAVLKGELTMIGAHGLPVAPDKVLETVQSKQERRLKMYLDAGLKLPQFRTDGSKVKWPKGIALLAIKEGISRQSFSSGLENFLQKNPARRNS